MTSGTTTSVPGALESEYQRLVELNRSRDRFLRTVSHELRTPLTSILSCTELLGDERTGPLTDDQREYVEIVGRGAGRLLTLVDELLELAGLESGRLPLDRQLLDLADVVAAAAQARRDPIAAAGLRFVLDVEAGPPVYADAERVGRLLEALLLNAEQHTPAGGQVTITARSGTAWEITVADTGVGIPPADQRTVFDAFTRGAAPVRGGRVGSGLGLALARTVVELHGGTLGLASTAGVGTTVTVRLPFAYGPVRA